MKYTYCVDFNNTGVIDDGFLHIDPSNNDGTEIRIEKVKDKKVVASAVIDVEVLFRNGGIVSVFNKEDRSVNKSNN